MLSASHTFAAIGTVWKIDTARPLKQREQDAVHKIIADFDSTYSRFKPDSLVSRARATAPGVYRFPASISVLLETYRKLADVSQKRINPFVGESLEQLGYDASYGFTPGTPRHAPSFDATATLSGTELTLSAPALLDIGAIGKGYLVDRIADLIARTHDSFTVDGSGDLVVAPSVTQTIGLEHPDDPSRVIGAVNLCGQALCASAINRRTWGEGLHHMIDATTGLPAATDVVATWAIADECIEADALATALFFVEPAKLFQVFGPFEFVVMDRRGGVSHTMHAERGTIFL